MRSLILAVAALAALPGAASAATIADAAGDFLPTYTAGAKLADLDVTSFSVNYNAAGAFFTLGATFAGAIGAVGALTDGFYVIGVNTGTGVNRPFASLGQENVIFNQAIVLRKDGTGSIGQTALDPANISIAGNIITARVALPLLPTTGFRPEQYGFNLWPRFGTGNNNQITDFSPENANLSVEGLQTGVPEPAAWGLMLLGSGLVGGVLRRRRATFATA